MPGCDVDFLAETAATGFALSCDDAGRFDGADATLVCIGHYPPLFAKISRTVFLKVITEHIMQSCISSRIQYNQASHRLCTKEARMLTFPHDIPPHSTCL
jgi:hypothetical protein